MLEPQNQWIEGNTVNMPASSHFRLCEFIDVIGQRCARRALEANPRCIHHFEHKDQVSPPINYLHALQDLLNEGDGTWRGFIFPRDFLLKSITTATVIDARGSKWPGSFEISGCSFEGSIDLTGGVIGSTFRVTASTFIKGLTAQQFNFQGDVWWTSEVTGDADFSWSVFAARADFSGTFTGPASFQRCSFGDVTRFTGSWHAAFTPGGPPRLDEPCELFKCGATFEGVDFKRPDRVTFINVDLTQVRMSDADFTGVSFVGVRWPRIGTRRGLFDEIWARGAGIAPELWLPRLESSYRNIRVAIEATKDFNTASDFYVGEMEARRNRLGWWRAHIFSIPAAYRILSGYGCDPTRAFLALLLFCLFYGIYWGVATYGFGTFLPTLNTIRLSIRQTVFIFPVLRPEVGVEEIRGWAMVIGSLLRIAILTQLALFILSLRGRIKRG